ncbi:MAG TPA: bifunctional phosphoribosylaminoimidazolecarboxamide formyltransferase/IMP cyclohydrolase [Candidatus Xenobia bacterium]
MSRALLSVYDKTGLVPFARRLQALGWTLVASGGTARSLVEAGLPVLPVEQVTGNPEAFGGRMKTISFQLEGGILFDRTNAVHVAEAERLGVAPVDMVVCNFYPFEAVVREARPAPEVVEMIDVGGPTMARAAAKNHAFVTVVPDPHAYDAVASELESRGAVSAETRRRLAAQTFLLLSRYDEAIASWLLREDDALRYGENPHQRGWFHALPTSDPLGLGHLQHLRGKALSYNNYLDLDGAIGILSHLDLLGDILDNQPACVIVKHANPCGAARGETIEEAFEKAWQGDPLAAFGGVVVLNRPVTLAIARALVDGGRFIEVLAAPDFSADAEAALQASKNRQLIRLPGLSNPAVANGIESRFVRGGLLQQDTDDRRLLAADLKCVSQVQPTAEQVADLLLAWHVCQGTRSNAIAIAKAGALVGSGAGQQDRVRCCRLAVEKAGERAQGAVAASDGFFPFPDGPQVLMAAGVKAIVHPGGSIRDQDTIDVCNAAGVALCTTSVRCFKH